MEKFLAVFFYSILCFSAFSQVTKLPTYAIRTSYPIDNIKDTIAPKAGGTVKAEWDITRDSVVFHYNDKKLLELEQIFRTVLNINGNSYPDTSRFYRKYLYDAKDRVLSVQHWTIIGSPDPNNPRHDGIYPYGDPYYHHAIQRIDSMAYDSHDKQTFYRRYEAYDFYNSNFTMVIKDSWENDYEYDQLGRLSKEARYNWEQNTKYRQYDNPFSSGYTHTYLYLGNTDKIKSRTFLAPAPGSALGFIPACDSLFTYDNTGRITSSKTFPYYTPQNGADYTIFSAFDTIAYLGNSTSKEYSGIEVGMVSNIDSKRPCGGIKYDKQGRIRFIHNGMINASFYNEQYSTCQNISYTLLASSRVHHYQDDSESNQLAVDSAYLSFEYFNGYTYNTNIYFDTIGYYGFKDINSPVTFVDDPQKNKANLNIYPNPADLEVNIQLNEAYGILRLYNMEGQILFSEEVRQQNTRLDIAQLQTGLYIVELNGRRIKLVKR